MLVLYKQVSLCQCFRERLQVGSLQAEIRLRSQSGQFLNLFKLVGMNLTTSFFPGLSQLSHLIACCIYVSLTYIYNALDRKRVDKRNPPKRVS